MMQAAEQLSLLPVDTAQPLRRPREPIMREDHGDFSYRFVRKRAWGAGPCVLWLGLNPANFERDDPTTWRNIGFSYRLGFGSLIMLNVYPFITSSPKELERWRADMRKAEQTKEVGSAAANWLENLHTINDHVADCSMHIAAWGSGVDREDLAAVMEWAVIDTPPLDGDIGEPSVDVPVTWHCLGRNADGSPKHTLARGKNWIPDGAQPMVWKPA